jgi:hypothetical protein
MYTKNDTTPGVFTPIKDTFLKSVQTNWYQNMHKQSTMDQFVKKADIWFKSTTINNIVGWSKLPCVDFTLGCTHFIESTAGALRWNIQVLPGDYSVYTFMGINTTQPGQLVPNVPLMVSLPQWKHLDIRPDWDKILNECEQKKISIHIDCAWLLAGRNFELDFSHPCIKSVGMSLSKYNSDWNRCGLRWSKQRRMDSITILNHYYPTTNANIVSAGCHVIDSIPRDYIWNTYGQAHKEICEELKLEQTNIVHVAKNKENLIGIGNIISKHFDASL